MKLASISLHPWEPLPALGHLHRELFRQLAGFPARQDRFPLFNLTSNTDEAVITAELPGVDPSNLEVTLSKGRLTVRGSFENHAPSGEGVVCHLQERPSGEFLRTIQLPFETEESAISASYQNGILNIRLPRAEKAKPRTIHVDSN